MMQMTEAHILTQDKLANDIYIMQLSTGLAEAACPGQFVNLYVDDGAHLLPRPISICDIDGQRHILRLVYRVIGEGTRWLAGRKGGETVRLLGPLGNGYAVDALRDREALCIGGGLGIPPMVGLVRALGQEGASVSALLGFRDEAFLTGMFEAMHVPLFLMSDSGQVGQKGSVVDGIRAYGLSPEVICACGPLPMLRALRVYAAEHGIALFVSLEERMACGVGACLGCVVPSVDTDPHSMVHNKRVCKDGPVFDAAEVVL